MSAMSILVGICIFIVPVHCKIEEKPVCVYEISLNLSLT